MPAQLTHADLSSSGAFPGRQDSHADCILLATLPGSSQTVQLEPSELTNPVLQSEHSLCDAHRRPVHSVPDAHLKGALHEVRSSETVLGGTHS